MSKNKKRKSNLTKNTRTASQIIDEKKGKLDKYDFLKTKEDSVRIIMQIYQFNQQIGMLNKVIKEKFNDNVLDVVADKINAVFSEVAPFITNIQSYEYDMKNYDNIVGLVNAFISLNNNLMKIDSIRTEHESDLDKADGYYTQLREEKAKELGKDVTNEEVKHAVAQEIAENYAKDLEQEEQTTRLIEPMNQDTHPEYVDESIEGYDEEDVVPEEEIINSSSDDIPLEEVSIEESEQLELKDTGFDTVIPSIESQENASLEIHEDASSLELIGKVKGEGGMVQHLDDCGYHKTTVSDS